MPRSGPGASRRRRAASAADFEVHAGELVGLAGLEGHGQDAFLQCLAGAAGDQGAYVPRERRAESLFESKSILRELRACRPSTGTPRRGRGSAQAQPGAAGRVRRVAGHQARAPGGSRSRRCRAATSRRSSSPAGWPPIRRAAAQRPDPRRRSRRQARPVPACWSISRRRHGDRHALHRGRRARRADGPRRRLPRGRTVLRAPARRAVAPIARRRVLRRSARGRR